MDVPDGQDLQPTIFRGADGNIYLLQITNCNSVGTESIPPHLLADVVQRSNSYTEELQRPPPFNPGCLDVESAKYCISNEELHKVIPKRQLVANVEDCIPKNLHKKPSAPPLPPNVTKTTGICKTSTTSHSKTTQVQIHKKISKENACGIFKGKGLCVPTFFHISDKIVPPHAIAVLPSILQIRLDNIFPRRNLVPNIRFGPVRGVQTKVRLSKATELIFESVVTNKPIFLLNRDELSVDHIDVSDKDKSNWLGLLPLGTKETANVWLYEEKGGIYGITVKPIRARVPLKIGYSKQYAVLHNLPDCHPVLDLQAVFPGSSQCKHCYKTFQTKKSLRLHTSQCHTAAPPERRYRCGYCSRTFTRMSSARRHTTLVCPRKAEKLNKANLPTEPENPDPGIFSQSVEEKLPSDESFQNYTNSLDFSTSLFDTDRIPNLDLSGSSKSEVDFNLYGIRDDNGLCTNIDFTKNSSSVGNSVQGGDSSTKKKKVEEMESCTYCDKSINSAKKRQHLRDCPKRRFACECGVVFRQKDKLAQHIHTAHVLKPAESEKLADKADDMPNECEVCKSRFKRRGMLVNHLWRAHSRRPTAALPVQRRNRLFPCSVCPKVYRAAAKRDAHMTKHHPRSQCFRPAPVEGERVLTSPAICAFCPRQYVTKAKLMQHVRASHPQQAQPPIPRKKAKNIPNPLSLTTEVNTEQQLPLPRTLNTLFYL